MVTESDKLCMEWGGRDAGREREFTQDEEVRKAEDGRLGHREGWRGRLDQRRGSWRCDLVARPLWIACLGLTLPVSSDFCFPL